MEAEGQKDRSKIQCAKTVALSILALVALLALVRTNWLLEQLNQAAFDSCVDAAVQNTVDRFRNDLTGKGTEKILELRLDEVKTCARRHKSLFLRTTIPTDSR